jgi:hypothetical protein
MRRRRCLADCRRVILQFILLAVLGLALGYSIPGPSAWAGLLVPVLFFLISLFKDGFTGELLVKFIVALVVMAAAIIVGRLIDAQTTARAEGG